MFYTQFANHKIEFWFKVKSYILIHTLSTTFVEIYGLFKRYALLTVYFHFHFCGRVGRGFVLFDSWGFWFVVLCGHWEEVELASYNLLLQSETFLWCRALIEITSYLVSHCLTCGYHFRLSFKNQWKRPLQACTAHLLIRWQLRFRYWPWITEYQYHHHLFSEKMDGPI